MEEAEALATNVAIMGTKMLATGSLPSLQETYGGAYSVRAVRTVESSRDEVEGIIKEKFEGAVTNYFDSHGQVQFNLPHERSRLGSIMGVMEGLKGDVIEQADEEEEAAPGTTVGGSAAGGSLAPANTGKGAVRVLTDYTVTGPTLEEVFMNVARENGTASGV
jgi:ATP-binding cassette subfamily A (ABC1) protein 3